MSQNAFAQIERETNEVEALREHTRIERMEMEELNTGYEFTKEQIAELESLRAENAMLKSSGIDKVVKIIAETEVWKECETLRSRLAEIEAQEPVGYAPITDSQWINIANANQAWFGYQANEAVEGAIKLVEEKAAENNAKLYPSPVVSPDVAALKDEISELKSHNKLIMDMYVQYSDENQSLKTELANWKSRCEHRVADIQLQAKRVVDLEATMRSLNTELESARKDAEWQPIETAPKTGRELILILTPSNFPQVAYSNTWWTAGFSVENKPTHWKPLPAPPAIEQAKGGV